MPDRMATQADGEDLTLPARRRNFIESGPFAYESFDRIDKQAISSGMVRLKVLNALLIASSMLGYLEWGAGNHAFLFQAEAEVIHKLVTHPLEALHPLTILPMLGQLLLVITLFQQAPGRWLTFIGLGTIGLLLGLMFVIGLLGLRLPIIASTLPFIVIAVLTVRAHLDGKRAGAA